MVQMITAQELKSKIAARGSLAIVDMRDEDTFATRHLLISSCLPLSRLEVVAPRMLPRLSLPIVVCDDGNGLAELGHKRLIAAGYSDVAILQGGISAWERAGYRLYNGVHVVSKAFAEVVEHECSTPHMDAEELNQKIAAKQDIVIFDSRSFEEYNNNSIPNAKSVPSAELVYRIHDLVTSPNTTIVINCGGRTRSIIGAQALINAGVPNPIYSLKNGTMGWHLAGLELIKGATAQAPDVSPAGLELARRRAQTLAKTFGVTMIDKATLAQFKREARDKTLHVIDVRSPQEFNQGHLPGSINCAGGQLVQETENWIADFQASIVLVDDTEVRAIVTASWLRQMGYKGVCVLREGLKNEKLQEGASVDLPIKFPLSAPEAVEIWPSGALLDGNAVIVDVSLSKSYIKAHVPGAWHAIRSRLLANLDKIAGKKRMVFTSEDGVLAKFAAAEVAAFAKCEVDYISGGNGAWQAAGLPMEGGDTHMLDEPDDVWYAPRDRKSDLERHMREYLSWEIDLVNVIQSDTDCNFDFAAYFTKRKG